MATWYKINASAKLTVRADSLNVRSGPQLYDFVKSVKAGEVVQATERALIAEIPGFISVTAGLVVSMFRVG